jgi:hypothetical protein
MKNFGYSLLTGFFISLSLGEAVYIYQDRITDTQVKNIIQANNKANDKKIHDLRGDVNSYYGKYYELSQKFNDETILQRKKNEEISELTHKVSYLEEKVKANDENYYKLLSMIPSNNFSSEYELKKTENPQFHDFEDKLKKFNRSFNNLNAMEDYRDQVWNKASANQKKKLCSFFTKKDDWLRSIKDPKNYAGVKFNEEQLKTIQTVCPWQGYDINDITAPERIIGYYLHYNIQFKEEK